MTQVSFTTRSILVVWLFLALLISSSAKGRRSDIDRVLADLPGYHLLKLTELDVEARAFFVEHFPKANPSVVHADFDGDGRLDYALVLRNDKSQVTKLVVLLCPEEGHCRNVSETDASAYSGSVYLRPVARGARISQTESADADSSPVRLKFSGIRMMYFGKGEVVLYWNEKLNKMVAIATGD